jgi:hypothetical protein
MAARSEKERADRDLRVSEVLEENRTLLVSGAAVVGILIVGLALWFAFAGDSETPSVSPTTDAQPSQTPDPSTQESEAPSTEAGTTSASRSPLANLALGDTLQLVVEAESDVLGMRIQRDGDARRPYWINEGETMAFPFTDRVIVWDNIQNVDLYLERHRYPEGQHLDARGRVVITRDSAEVFADTVRGTEASFPTPTIRPLDETFPDPEETEDEPEEESVPVNEGGAANEDAAADTTTPDVSPEDTTQSEAASPSDTTSAPNGTSASNGNSSSDGMALNMLR